MWKYLKHVCKALLSVIADPDYPETVEMAVGKIKKLEAGIATLEQSVEAMIKDREELLKLKVATIDEVLEWPFIREELSARLHAEMVTELRNRQERLDDANSRYDAMVAERRELLAKQRDYIDTVKACLVAAGGSSDDETLEREVKAAGQKPSDFIRKQLQHADTDRNELYGKIRKLHEQLEVCEEKAATAFNSLCRLVVAAEQVLINTPCDIYGLGDAVAEAKRVLGPVQPPTPEFQKAAEIEAATPIATAFSRKWREAIGCAPPVRGWELQEELHTIAVNAPHLTKPEVTVLWTFTPEEVKRLCVAEANRIREAATKVPCDA